RARGRGRPGGRLFGGVPAQFARRLAVDRAHRCRALGRGPRSARADPGRRRGAIRGGRAMMRVLAVGPAATVQDLGRPGWFDSGVGLAGAADRGSLRLANRLVGNPEGAAAIEVLLGGVAMRAERPHVVAVTGAPAPASVDG